MESMVLGRNPLLAGKSFWRKWVLSTLGPDLGKLSRAPEMGPARRFLLQSNSFRADGSVCKNISKF